MMSKSKKVNKSVVKGLYAGMSYGVTLKPNYNDFEDALTNLLNRKPDISVVQAIQELSIELNFR
jgi:hypothetical protein